MGDALVLEVTPLRWALTIGLIVGLLLLDLGLAAARPHVVKFREAAAWSVFFIVVAGVIMNKIQRRRQGYSAAPQTFGTDRPTDMQRLPPEYLFNSLQQPRSGAPVI